MWLYINPYKVTISWNSFASISRTSYALVHWKVLSSCFSKRDLLEIISPFKEKIFTALMKSEFAKLPQFHVMFILSVFIKRLF